MVRTLLEGTFPETDSKAESVIGLENHLWNVPSKRATMMNESPLTESEKQILEAVAVVISHKAIAKIREVGVRTIQIRMNEINKKLDSSSVPNSVYIALKEGWIE